MKTRDSEALEYVLNSGYWKLVPETGEILTSRDTRGRPTDPAIWRPCTFLSHSKKSQTRKRLWVNGRRVYANRAAWVLHNKQMIPEGYQVDHADDDAMNDRPENLVLLAAESNRVKELANGKVKRFAPLSVATAGNASTFEPHVTYVLPSGDPLIAEHSYTTTKEGHVFVNVKISPETWYKISEPIDWRLTLVSDIKRWFNSARTALRRAFGRFWHGL